MRFAHHTYEIRKRVIILCCSARPSSVWVKNITPSKPLKIRAIRAIRDSEKYKHAALTGLNTKLSVLFLSD